MFKKVKFNDFSFKFSLLIILFVLLIFTVCRLSLYLAYKPIFAALTGGEVFKAFFFGVKFDLSMTALVIGPALFFLNIPVKSAKWVKAWAFVILIKITALIIYLAADLVYFSRVHRHIGEELLLISSDWGFIINYALKDYLLPIIIVIAATAAFAWLIFKFINKKYTYSASLKWTPLKLILLLIFIILGTRGGIKGKNLSIADVYRYSKSASGAALTLNGAFTGYHIWRKGSVDIVNKFPKNIAIANMQRAFIAQDEKVINPDYPLMRVKEPGADFKNFNVLIILLESWTPKYIDAFGHNNYGVTPVIDKIAQNGVIFTNAYSVGLRSLSGFASVLGGVPMLPSLPAFGEGLEVSEVSQTFHNFAQQGYYTFFAQTSLRHSFRLCPLSFYFGAKDCYGWEDLPPHFTPTEEAEYGYDYDLFMFTADKIKSLKGQNFFSMLFTGTTHEPFAKIDPQFEIYERKTWQDGYLNSLAYSDWGIGQLLEAAKADGWFDNTIFIFVADHITRKNNPSLYDNFNIPLLIYAPKLLKPAKVDYVVSQLDILPTVYELTGLSVPYTAMGRSLFDDTPGRFAFITEGTNMGIITAEGALRHSGNKLLEVEKKADNFDAQKAEETLLSFDRAAYTLLKNNKWFKSEK